MPDPIQIKLSAYLDGELKQQERLEVENHLQTCQGCREELEELKRVSSLLRESRMPEFTSPMDFKAQVMLQLPRRDETGQEKSKTKFLWVAPVMVVVAFIFVQVTLNLSTWVELAANAGWVNVDTGAPSQMLWFSAMQWLPGDLLNTPGLAWLTMVNNAGLFTQSLMITLLVQITAGILYWGVFTLAWRKTAGGQLTGLANKM
jgi:hypothetical protein